MSLRWRIAIALAALAAAATAVVSFTSYFQTKDRLYDEIDTSLTQTTNALFAVPSRPTRSPGGGSSGVTAQDIERLASELDVDIRQVVTASGQIFLPAAEGTLAVTEREQEVARTGEGTVSRNVTVNGDRYRILTTGVRTTGGEGAAIQVGRDLSETLRVLNSLRARYWVIGGGVSVLAAVIGWFVAGSASRSLVRLTKAVEAVGQSGDLRAEVAITGRDEVGRLGRAFDDMIGALRRSREQQQQLVQDAGHELRTPLTSVRTNVSVLRRHDRLSPEAFAQTLDDLDSELGELTGLVNEIVELATDARDSEPVEEVALDALARRAAERVQRRTGHLIAISSDGSCVTGRPAAIERAITNLLDNAAKFDDSNNQIELTISAGMVVVRDHGPGFAAGEETMVFERFWRAPASRQKPGSGLGLAIVRDVANAHGGMVWARNHPDGGAIVGMKLTN